MENITIFIDNVGRMIIGSLNEQATNKTTLGIENPCVVNIQADQQSGQMSVQLLPFVFSEFVKNKEENITWKFSKSNIVTSDNMVLDERVEAQYKQIVSSTQTAVQSLESNPTAEPEVVKLFDE